MKIAGKIGVGLAVGAVGLGAAFWAMGGGRPDDALILPPLGPARVAGDTLTVATWNVHYGYGPVLDRGRGASRAIVIDHLERIAAEINTWDADVVALQEVDLASTRGHGIDQLAWLRRATGLPFCAWTSNWQARWVPHPLRPFNQQIGGVRSGQALLSRMPLSDARRHPLPQPASKGRIYNRFYLHRAVLEAKLDLGLRGFLNVFNTHFEAFERANCDEHASLTAPLLAAAGPRAMLLGDLNSVPPEAALKHDFPDEPETDMRQDQAIATLRALPGWREAIPTAQSREQEAATHSFPAWEPNRRLDYIFLGPGLEAESSRVPRQTSPPSDHLPVIARINLV